MDSLTQIALGACIGVAIQDRRTMDVASGLVWLWRRLKGEDIT